MKRTLLVLIMASLGILGFASIAMADRGFDIYTDYSQLSADGYDADMITLGLDYGRNSLLLGGNYSFSTSVGGSVIDAYKADGYSIDENQKNYFFYGGYDFMKDENIVLGVIASYLDIKNEATVSGNGLIGFGDRDITSLGIGFMAGGKIDAFQGSIMYIYGLDNNVKIAGVKDDDFNFNYYQLKGSYYFNDMVGLSLVYRDFDYDGDNLDGLGLGVDFKF